MSRGGRDDDRAAGRDPLPERDRPGHGGDRQLGRTTLRPGADRQLVVHRDHTYRLRDSDIRLLVTVGAFRAVRVEDLHDTSDSRDGRTGEVRHLRDEGLLTLTSVSVNGDTVWLAALTPEGKSLLEAHRDESGGGSAQAYYAGLVKPRELAHDSQLLRLFELEADRIEAAGGRVERVVLDYELKRDYQRFLNRESASDDPTVDMAAFAADRDLPIIDGHLELPDLRIEYEGPDGSLQHRDLELVTEHYSRAQLAGKQRAGFRLYRAAGARPLGGGSSKTGGTPVDPHHLEWLA